MATRIHCPPWTTSIVLFYTVLSGLQLTYGLIRCYCDDPQCVESGYMCKSDHGCYSEFPLEADAKSRPLGHGCVESLETLQLCESGVATTTPQPPNRTEEAVATDFRWSGFQCCREDMCNYNSIELKIEVNSHNVQNTEGFTDSQMDTAHDLVVQSKAVWFRAAVIAVPIAGGCILILLILLAVRMLKNEERRFKRLQAKRRETLNALHRGCYDNRNFKNVHINNLENNLQTSKRYKETKSTKINNDEVKNVNEFAKSVVVVQWDKHNINQNIDVV
ncbi:BMP and activin membrane-bound inhibitor homolog [Ptychodera flava]|uniref:BMP and activin membrane-bound inhibitor homolog n=1 Tax=Ptychodera flava TaxID=63121 RepID=UPI00396AB0E7